MLVSDHFVFFLFFFCVSYFRWCVSFSSAGPLTANLRRGNWSRGIASKVGTRPLAGRRPQHRHHLQPLVVRPFYTLSSTSLNSIKLDKKDQQRAVVIGERKRKITTRSRKSSLTQWNWVTVGQVLGIFQIERVKRSFKEIRPDSIGMNLWSLPQKRRATRICDVPLRKERKELKPLQRKGINRPINNTWL